MVQVHLATVTFVETGWFETEEELDEIQRAFVNVLRDHAEAWPLNPAETCLVLPGDEAYGYPLALGQSSYLTFIKLCAAEPDVVDFGPSWDR